MPGKICTALALVLATVCPTVCPGQDSKQPFAFSKQQLRPLERVVLDLMKAARPDEANALLRALEDFGYPEESIASLARRQAKIRPAQRNPQQRIARITKSLASITSELAAQLSTITDPDRREQIARLLLRLDHESVQAHLALDQVQLAGRWVTPEEGGLAARKAEIQSALQAARSLQPEVEVSRSEHELLLHVHGRAGHLVTSHGLRIHTLWPATRTKRLVQNLLRALAFSKYLIDGGTIALPKDLDHTSVLFTGKPDYLEAIQYDAEHGRINRNSVPEAERFAAYYRQDRTLVNNRTMENHALAGIFSHITGIVNNRLHRQAPQPSLIVGHANWLLMALAGAHLPGIAFNLRASNKSRTVDGSKLPDEAQYLIGSGLMGARSWLRHRVIRGEDPAWSRSFVDQVGKIDGEDMLKTTFVVEYLQLQGPLRQILAQSQGPEDGRKESVTATMERALGMPLHEFEQSWRHWMRGTGNRNESILERLGGSPDPDAEANRAVIRYLASIRESAHGLGYLPGNLPEVSLDSSLSRQASLHASYLELHRDQLALWPNAHEEYSDRKGFTAEGSWAGNHSVIAPGVHEPKVAIDMWMGTFFHRLPLLEPGLLRVGWGLEGSTAVLDTNSMVRNVGFEWEVAWPPDAMQDVPRRFMPELPNPFPGEDQSEWGYPVTLQIGPRIDRPDPEITLTLRLGSADGAVVPSLFSSPHDPGNLVLVPARSWCLIPKRHLQPKTKYHVQAIFDGDFDQAMTWTFETR